MKPVGDLDGPNAQTVNSTALAMSRNYRDLTAASAGALRDVGGLVHDLKHDLLLLLDLRLALPLLLERLLARDHLKKGLTVINIGIGLVALAHGYVARGMLFAA